MESAGAGAVVLPSLFEEHVIAWKLRNGGNASEREQRLIDRVNRLTQDTLVPDVDTYLSVLDRARVQCSIPVIASLNGESAGDWLDFAGELQAAGAKAIELNIHHRPVGLHDTPRDLENQVIEVVRMMRESISVPLFLKLHREYTSVAHLARRLVSGVQGLVLYARDPEIDISLYDCQLKSHWGLTAPGSISPTLQALMSVYGYCPSMPLAGNGGIAQPEDVIKILLAGADAAMIVSAIYRQGPDVIRTMLDGLVQYMESNQLGSLNALRARRPLEFASDEERLTLIRGLTSNAGASRSNSCENTMESDRWGHLVRSSPLNIDGDSPTK